MKDFISRQIEKQPLSFTADNFLTLCGRESSMVVIEVAHIDYSLSDIARIVESNNARVMNLFVLPIVDSDMLLLSIKLDLIDISPVLMSFERFDYKVLYYQMKNGDVTDTHRERLNELLYYLNM